MAKIFRVFFSSTFSDFVEERNALQEKVFKPLKEFCAARGTRFQPIDLRWGISDNVALQQSTIQICLEEIKRCQDLTPRPNFLIFLGERYGWTPPPSKIPKTEFEVITAQLSDDDKTLIKKWYREDENECYKIDNGTFTTIYELQPRGKEYENYKKWEPIEIRIRDTLLEAARKTSITKKEMVKYFASATHQEILIGALEAHDVNSHVHCFFRKAKGLPVGANSVNFFESKTENNTLLSKLKDELEQKLVSNIHKYEIDLGNKNEKEKYLEKFCNDVYESLKTTISQELEKMEEISALDEEVNAHIKFGRDHSKIFVDREEILNKIVDYVGNNNRMPFIIYGKPGSGKSALMAKALEYLERKNPDLEYIIRFIGTTPSSTNSIALLTSICEQIINKFGTDFKEEIPSNYYEIKETFIKLLRLTPEKKRVVILLDALDQLPKRDKGRNLAWLPQKLPENVKIVTSFATDDNDIMNTVNKEFPKISHELKKLTLEEGGHALNILLKNALRKLNSEQRQLVLEKFAENGLPLYLKLAFEESCTWNSYSDIHFIKLASDVEGLILLLFERLYRDHTKEIVERILSYIVAARNGLTEDEIIDVMSSDHYFLDWYKKQIHYNLPDERLPWIIWSRLRFDLEPYFTIRGVDHTSTIVFFHRQFNELIKKNLLSKEHHQVLANYFFKKQLYIQEANAQIYNYRKLSELIYNLRKAKMWKRLKNTLTDLEFIESKCSALMTNDLLIDYDRSFIDLTLKRKYKKEIKEFKQFVFNQAHILRKYPYLTIQQAINQPDNTLPSKAGKNFINSMGLSHQWIEWINKPQERDPCILTFTGHSGSVYRCVFSPDGTKVVSTSGDDTLKLWDVETGEEIRSFIGHSAWVQGCAFSPDGRKVVSTSGDNTLKLWDVETGKEIKSFKGHSNAVYGCAFSPDGKKLLSASGDETLKLWDVETGLDIRTLKGHKYDVLDCAFSPDGKKLLSASVDETLKLWDVKTGNEITTLSLPSGHSHDVNSCAFSPDGKRVISASSDHTLKLWEVKTGTEIRTFTGHSDIVTGVSFSPDGTRVISTSWDKTLKLWDVETGKEIRSFIGHSSSLEGCAFSPDGRNVVSASADGTLKLWNIESDVKGKSSNKHSNSVNGCTFSSDGTKLISASSDFTLKLWDVRTAAEIKTLVGHSYNVNGCTFSPDGMTVVSASWSNNDTLKLWDVETGNEIKTFPSHILLANDCAFSPDGTKILAALVNKTLKLWDVKTSSEIKTFIGHSDKVHGCAFSPDGTKAVSASSDNTLKLWDVETGTEIRTFEGHKYDVLDCAFSPDGKKLLSASMDETLKLWDVTTATEIKTLVGHSHNVNGCAFSPDGKKVVSASSDNTLKLWGIESGNVLMTFPTFGAAYCVAIGVNGFIAAGDQSGWVYILHPHNVDLVL